MTYGILLTEERIRNDKALHGINYRMKMRRVQGQSCLLPADAFSGAKCNSWYKTEDFEQTKNV